jgi:hypothetical protein
MTIKSALSVIALTAALGFTGSAFAQDAVSAEDLPAVQDRCDDLEVAATTESITEESDGLNSDEEVSEDQTATAAIDTVDDASEIENATTTIDLDTVTLEQCEEWGLLAS